MRRLTIEERQNITDRRANGESLDQIARALGRCRETVWYHINKITRLLSPEKRREILSEAGRKGANAFWAKRKPLLEEERRQRFLDVSKSWKMFGSKYASLSRSTKGRIAEVAVVLRLLFQGADAYMPELPDGPRDIVVCNGEKAIRLQVKAARRHPGNGGPVIGTVSDATGKRYTKGECDFLVGYDPINDTCYVIPVEKTNKSSMRLRDSHKERWDLLGLT